MIKSMKVLRKSKGEITSSLPFKLRTISDITLLNSSELDKMIILGEQYILSKYLEDMNKDNTEIKSYKELLKKLSIKSVPTTSNDKHFKDVYSKMYSIFSNLVYKDIIDTNTKELFYETRRVDNKSSILDKDFIFNYLKYVTKYDNDTTGNRSLLLVPTRKGSDIIFNKIEFNGIDFNSIFTPESKNTTLSYINAHNWKGKNIESVLDTIQSFTISKPTGIDRTLSQYIHDLFRDRDTSMINTSLSKSNLLHILSYYYVNKSTNVSKNTLSFILEKIGYESISEVFSDDPSLLALEKFNSYNELSSFKKMIKFEGEDDEDDEVEDTEDEDTSLDDDTSGDDFSDDDSESDDSSDDDFSDDSGDDFGGDDSSSDTSSSDDNQVEEDAVETPRDPLSILMEISTTETLNEYFERNEIISLLGKLIANPPKSITSDTLEFLKTWYTQWVSTVSVNTTKEVLSRLGL